MRLLTAHRILIATFIVFSLFLAVVEMRRWLASGSSSTGLTALLSIGAAIGFAVYLRSLRGKTL